MKKLPIDRNSYQTPGWFLRYLCVQFGRFHLDAFATRANSVAPRYYAIDEGRSAFDQPWTRDSDGKPTSVFANPPYSSDLLGPAVHKMAWASRVQRSRVVGLIPPNTDTRWWHDVVMREAVSVGLCKGRISFEVDGVPAKGNTGHSCVVLFDELLRDPLGSPRFYSIDLKDIAPQPSPHR